MIWPKRTTTWPPLEVHDRQPSFISILLRSVIQTLMPFELTSLREGIHGINHGVNFKLYADDTQIYMALDNIDHTKSKPRRIMKDVRRWMQATRSEHLKVETK